MSKVLVIGAGAVGQVFARHLQVGGSDVTFYVRNKHVDRLGEGLVLYHLNKFEARKRPINFKSFAVISDASQDSNGKWDQIYLCVPSEALYTGLLDVVSQFSGDATIITLPPGLDDRRVIEKSFDPSKIVSGMIAFMSYAAPLEGETFPQPGTAYWFPPFVASPFSGPPERVSEVVASLRNGRLPARVHQNVPVMTAFSVAAMTPLTAGLQCVSWSLKQFRYNRVFEIAFDAIGEAIAVVADYYHTKPPLFMKVLNKTTIRTATRFFPRRYPFDMQKFISSHYTKLSDQTVHLIQTYINLGVERGLSVTALEELKNALT